MDWWERGHRDFWGWSLQILKWGGGVMVQTLVSGKISNDWYHPPNFFPNHRVPSPCIAPQSTPPHLLSLQNVTYQGTAPFHWINHAPHLHIYFQCEIYILGCILFYFSPWRWWLQYMLKHWNNFNTKQLNPESQKYILHNRSQKPNDDKGTLIQSGK